MAYENSYRYVVSPQTESKRFVVKTWDNIQLADRLLLLNHNIPFFDRMSSDNPGRNIGIFLDKELGCLGCGKDEECACWHFHGLGTGWPSAEAGSFGNEFFGQSQVTFSVGTSLFKDIGNVVVSQEVLSCRKRRRSRVSVHLRCGCGSCQKGQGRRTCKSRRKSPHDVMLQWR